MTGSYPFGVGKTFIRLFSVLNIVLCWDGEMDKHLRVRQE